MSEPSTRVDSRRSRVGGKAAALMIAREAGLPVPVFFVLEVAEVRTLVAGGDAAEKVRQRLKTEYQRLGGGHVAVRSSAEAEDGARSFAGQYETRLDREGAESVEGAVLEVAASADAERVRDYGASSRGSDRMAVLIQRMVPACAAGVAFSRNPLTYQPEIVIEAVPGPGEALVGGLSTPSQVVLGREDLGLIDGKVPGFTDGELLGQVGRLALECESLLGAPQDVEWAWDGTSLWLLQARPITGFEDVEAFSDTWSSEVWPGLIKPLVFDVGDTAVNAAWGRILSSVAGRVDVDWRRMSALAASRAYFNDSLLGNVLARAGLPENTLESVVRGERPRLREGSAYRLALSAGRLMAFLTRNTRWLARIERELPQLMTRIAGASADAERLDAPELAERLEILLAVLEDAAYLSAVTTISMGLRSSIASLAQRTFGVDSSAGTSAGTAGTRPLQELAAVARLISALPEADRSAVRAGDPTRIDEVLNETEAGREVLRAMEELVRRWGHIALVNTDFSTPAWRDEPEMLWRLAAASREAAAQPDLPHPPATGALGRAVIGSRLRSLQRFMDARDEVNDALALTYDAWRIVVRAAGDALVPAVLEAVDEIYYLRYDELLDALRGRPAPELRALVAQRAATLAADAELSPPHRLWDLRLPPRHRMLGSSPRAKVGQELTGTPASPGTVTGTARVLGLFTDADDLGPDDILVVKQIDVGWTPLFTVVGGVVTAVGGALSHAAVVARELGIPAVVAVEDATALIPSGALVRLDGSNGTVTILDDEDAPDSISDAGASSVRLSDSGE